jgi:hypothetical protein
VQNVFRRRLVVRFQGASTAASFQIRCWEIVAPCAVAVYDQAHKAELSRSMCLPETCAEFEPGQMNRMPSTPSGI